MHRLTDDFMTIVQFDSSDKHTRNVSSRSGCREQRRVLSFFPLSLTTIVYLISQEVCRQMDSVFKELLLRQGVSDPSTTAASSPSAQAAQRKGKRDGRRGR